MALEFSEEQFKRFIEELSAARRLREDIIEIKTIVKLNFKSYEEYRQDMADKISHAQATAEKLHARIDEQQSEINKVDLKASRLFWIATGSASVVGVVTLILAVAGRI